MRPSVYVCASGFIDQFKMSSANANISATKTNWSSYNKKQVLALLKKINCDPNKSHVFEERFANADVKEYIDTRAKAYQVRLDGTMQPNKHYLNLTTSANDLNESGAAVLNDNTLPATFEAIANIEAQPEPSTVNGINLRRLYKWLANLMAGYPTEELEEGPTKDFLYKCFATLMQRTETTDVEVIRRTLSQQDEHTHPVYSWLCNSNYSQYSEQLLKSYEKRDSP